MRSQNKIEKAYYKSGELKEEKMLKNELNCKAENL